MAAQKGKDLLLKVDQDGSGDFLTVAGLRTRTLTFKFSGSGGIDNLQVTAPVPLPASAVLLLGGLGALGVLRRRKRAA